MRIYQVAHYSNLVSLIQVLLSSPASIPFAKESRHVRDDGVCDHPVLILDLLPLWRSLAASSPRQLDARLVDQERVVQDVELIVHHAQLIPLEQLLEFISLAKKYLLL